MTTKEMIRCKDCAYLIMERNVDWHNVADILYNMTLEMDYAETIEYADEMVDILTEEINNASDTLKYVLNFIAEENWNMLGWYKKTPEYISLMKGE